MSTTVEGQQYTLGGDILVRNRSSVCIHSSDEPKSVTNEPHSQMKNSCLNWRHDSHANVDIGKFKEDCSDENKEDTKNLSLAQLSEGLHAIFSSDNICVEDVQGLLAQYDPTDRDDWRDYVRFDDFKYTRNLVDIGNHNFEVMLIGWGEDQQSSIHDHAGSHCFMKVIDGSVEESLYHWPSDIAADDDCHIHGDIDDEGNRMKLKQPRKIHSEGCLYINDSIGLHRIGNPSLTKKAVTLHIYSPPILECHRFDEKTGRKYASGKCTFFSKSGLDINGGSIVKMN